MCILAQRISIATTFRWTTIVWTTIILPVFPILLGQIQTVGFVIAVGQMQLRVRVTANAAVIFAKQMEDVHVVEGAMVRLVLMDVMVQFMHALMVANA